MSVASRVGQGLHLVAGGGHPPGESEHPGEGREPGRRVGASAAMPWGQAGHKARPTLSELFASPQDGGWAGFLLHQLAPGKPLLWVQERMAILETGRVHPPGLGAFAGDLIHVEARDAKAALWAMEEGLRCPGLSAVVGELWGDPRALDFTATRRLAVAAERHGVAAFLVRLGGHANLSGARLRWQVASAPSLLHSYDPRAPGAPAWDAELFRARGTPPGRWRLAGDHAEDRLLVVADPGDRALEEGPLPKLRSS